MACVLNAFLHFVKQTHGRNGKRLKSAFLCKRKHCVYANIRIVSKEAIKKAPRGAVDMLSMKSTLPIFPAYCGSPFISTIRKVSPTIAEVSFLVPPCVVIAMRVKNKPPAAYLGDVGSGRECVFHILDVLELIRTHECVCHGYSSL